MVHAMEVKVDVTLRLSKQLHESSMMYEKNQEYVDWPFLPHPRFVGEGYIFLKMNNLMIFSKKQTI